MNLFACLVCKEKFEFKSNRSRFTCSHPDKICFECSTKVNYCQLCRNSIHDMVNSFPNSLKDVSEYVTDQMKKLCFSDN